MTANNPCSICGAPGIPGLTRGQGKCQHHWTAGVWGKVWAEKVTTDSALVSSLSEVRRELATLSPAVRALIGLALERGAPECDESAAAMRLQNRGIARMRLRAALDQGAGS